MTQEQQEWIKRRYGFEDWPSGWSKNIQEVGRRVERQILVDWKLESVDRDEIDEDEKDLPVETRAIFLPRAPGRQEILSVDTWECNSAYAAREFLLEILNDFQSPSIERVVGHSVIGDLTFVHGRCAILFSHANLIALVRNAGRDLVDVSGVAQELYEKLTQDRNPF